MAFRRFLPFLWLKLDTPDWGSLPILASSGEQCTTIQEVDAQVQDYWVRQVWYMHAKVDAEERWKALCASPFFRYIPTCRWPTSRWTWGHPAADDLDLFAGSSWTSYFALEDASPYFHGSCGRSAEPR